MSPRKIVLDTGALLSVPSALSTGLSGARAIVPGAVLDEIAQARRYNPGTHNLESLIREAVNAGFAEVVRDGAGYDMASTPTPGHSAGAALALVERLSTREPETFLATADTSLLMLAKRRGLKTLTLAALRELVASDVVTSKPDLANQAADVGRRERRYIAGSTIVSAALGFLASLLLSNANWVLQRVNVWGTLAAVPALGFTLYWIRSRYRLVYGISELLIGIITAVRVFLPDFRFEGLSTVAILQALGGLYITVRGLDNMGKGLMGTRFYPRWRSYFGDP